MAGRFLKGLGVLTLVGVAGASVAALLLLREKVHVSIAGETSSQRVGPDPVVLLRDDVASLRRDLGALTETLSKNFEALEARGDAGDADRRAALDRALAALEAQGRALADRVDASGAAAQAAVAASEARTRDGSAATTTAVAALADRLARLERALAERPDRAAPPPTAVAPPTPAAPAGAAAPPAPPPPAPVVTAPPPAAPGVPAPAGVSPTAAVPTPAAPPAAPVLPAGTSPAARRKTFLAFSLPSQSVDFTRAMRFEVLPDLSRVGFDAKSTLHDFSGVTSDVSGAFTARLSAPGREVTGEVRASATTLDTGLADRNTEMAGTLDSAKFPTLTFRLASFQAAQTDPKTLASTGTGRGTLTIHGVAREVSVPLRISVDDARRVVVEGEVTVRMTDFGVTPPRKVVITVDDAVKVWVALRARATGAAE